MFQTLFLIERKAVLIRHYSQLIPLWIVAFYSFDEDPWNPRYEWANVVISTAKRVFERHRQGDFCVFAKQVIHKWNIKSIHICKLLYLLIPLFANSPHTNNLRNQYIKIMCKTKKVKRVRTFKNNIYSSYCRLKREQSASSYNGGVVIFNLCC